MKPPMLASLAKKPFDHPGWIFEIKWDGYRALAYKNRKVRLISRGQKSLNERFPHLIDELKKLKGNFIVDGEIVILDSKGRPKFQLLQNYPKKSKGTPYFYLFDILSHNHRDLTSLPLLKRKEILKNLLRTSPSAAHLRFSDYIERKGKAFFRKASKWGLEGILAKKADSPYQFRRSRYWLKIKTKLRQEVVIGGFTKPKGTRKYFGALLVGIYEKKKLRYVGHVGGGFDKKLLKEVHSALQKCRSKSCPFLEISHPNAPATWVKPKLVCEVSFAEWTKDGILRQPIFIGMRIDKEPKEVFREQPI